MPNDIGNAAELALPEPMTNNATGSIASTPIILLSKDTSELWLYAEHVKEIPTNPKTSSRSDFATLGKIEPGNPPCSDTCESLLSITNLFPERIGDRGITH